MGIWEDICEMGVGKLAVWEWKDICEMGVGKLAVWEYGKIYVRWV